MQSVAYTVPTTEPTKLRAGDTWQWRREDLSDWPASSYTLTYYVRNAASHFNITAAADGDNFAVSVPMATTAGYTAGEYDWYAFVSDGSERYQIDAGRFEVLPDVSAAAAYDGRGWAKQMLDLVEAALLSRATDDQLDVINTTLGDRGLSRDRGGLIALRSQLQAEAKREEAAIYGTGKSRVLVRFA